MSITTTNGDGGGSGDSRSDDPDRRAEREIMVRDQIAGRGIRDERVLEALRAVPRHAFLPPHTDAWRQAYADSAQPIAEGQTISQPYIVALMTASLRLCGTERVLEIGAGSGYQTAILARLAREVIAVERHAALAERARHTLESIGALGNVQLHVGDGSRGWPEQAPYDAILCAAVAPAVPPALIAQLAPGGRLILPVGPENATQHLLLITKGPDGGPISQVDLGEVAFVPLVGAHGFGLPADLGETDI